MNTKTKLVALVSATALVIGSITGCSTTSKPPADTPAQKKQSLDAAVDAALAQLYASDPASRELVAKSRAVLVFPSIVTAGFVVGGSYGQGALRVGGQTAGYYKTAAGSVGLLAGAESKAMYILFMTDEALAKFRASNGWTAGADASVAMMRTGASASVDSATVAQQAVIGYVLVKGGLMANLSLEGTKVSPLEL
jgi:lipid-binding SYLF domain-containing protein